MNEPIDKMVAEAVQVGEGEARPTGMLLLMPYGMIYQRVNFPIVRDENHPQGWQIDVDNPGMLWPIEMVMN